MLRALIFGTKNLSFCQICVSNAMTNISKIERLSLFKQMQDIWKVSFSCLLIVIALIVSHYIINENVSYGIIIGALGGVLGNWRATAISRIYVTGESLKYVTQKLADDNYVACNGGMCFKPDSHRLLRFNSQNVFISPCGNKFIIDGPYYEISKINKIFM